MPSRRTMELMVIVVLAMKPVTAVMKLWAHKTLASSQPGTASYAVAEVLNPVVSA